MTTKAIVCVHWGDKYPKDFVRALKQQVERYCSYEFNFYCFTDNVTEDYDREFPHNWNDRENGKFWAYRKIYMFDDVIQEDEILYLDLDVLIHDSIDKFFELDMSKPWIVKGWWNDLEICKKNYSKMQSPILNSSVIRWNNGQMQPVFNHVEEHLDILFFTYPTIDNYFSHFWYDLYDDNNCSFSVFSWHDIESHYKGRVHPSYCSEDLPGSPKPIIELFNNSALEAKDDLEKLWPRFNILQT
jgi:lipopolysaccharide biosynthesis glycosyltransferase